MVGQESVLNVGLLAEILLSRDLFRLVEWMWMRIYIIQKVRIGIE